MTWKLFKLKAEKEFLIIIIIAYCSVATQAIMGQGQGHHNSKKTIPVSFSSVDDLVSFPIKYLGEIDIRSSKNEVDI